MQLNGLLWLSNREIIHQFKSINHFLVRGVLYIASNLSVIWHYAPVGLLRSNWEAADTEDCIGMGLLAEKVDSFLGHVALILSDWLGKTPACLSGR